MALMNFFNPRWKHSAPEVRIVAVKQCTDPEIIATIAIDDSDKDVRLAAIKKIDNIPHLEKALNSETDEYIRKHIKKSLNKLYSAKILNSSNLSECKLYIQKIDEEELLAKLVKSINDDDVASLICSKITNEPLLAKIAKNSDRKKLSLELLKRISDVDLLKKISKSATLSAVKKEALRKVHEFTGVLDLIQKEISIKAKYEKLCQYAKELCNSTDWEKSETEFTELKDEWKDLDTLPDKDYKALEEKFESTYTYFTKIKQDFKKETEVRAKKLKVLEDICIQLQQDLESDDLQTKKAEVYKLKKKWNREIENISYAEEMVQRFAKLIDDYDNKYKTIQEAQGKKLTIAKDTLSGFLTEIEGFIKAESFYPNINRVKEIEAQWKEVQGDLIRDDDDLNLRFRKAIKIFFKDFKMEKEVHHWERWENHALKVGLCKKAAALEHVNDMHAVAKSLKELRSEWKSIGDVPRENAMETWKTFDQTCNNIYKKCQIFYADLNEQKEKNLILKVIICEKAELLKDRENNAKNADAIKKLQREWKEIGWLPREKERETFERFNNACNTFFERRNAEYEKLKSIYDEHAKAKELLCQEAEKIIDMNIEQAESFEKDLKKEWRRIGDVARDEHQELWTKFNEPFIQFHKQMQLQAPENLTKKETLYSQLETLLDSISESSDFKELEKRVKEIKKSWSLIGPVPEEAKQACNSKYSTTMDEFYKKQDLFYQEQDKLQTENMNKKKAVINTLESLFESNNEKSVSTEQVNDLQSQWEAIGEIPAESAAEIEKQYRGLSDSILSGDRKFFNMMKQEKKQNLKMKIELCVKAEKLVNIQTDDSMNNLDLSSLADELNFAIGSNFIEEKSITPKEKMKKFKEDWNTIGAISLLEDEKVNKRFTSACDKLL